MKPAANLVDVRITHSLGRVTVRDQIKHLECDPQWPKLRGIITTEHGEIVEGRLETLQWLVLGPGARLQVRGN